MPENSIKRVAPGQQAPRLQGKPSTTAQDDPGGWKAWTAFGVAYNLYGNSQNGTVDVNRDISGDASVNPDVLMFKINEQGSFLAPLHSLQWTNVDSAAVQRLRTVSDLETLVVNNLSTAAGQ